MGWVKRAANSHKHNYPLNVKWPGFDKPDSVSKGDEWLCDCGAVYVVNDIHIYGDQKEGHVAYLTWKYERRQAPEIGTEQ